MSGSLAWPVGSTPWLLAHEIRLTWRGLGRGAWARGSLWVLGSLFLIATLALGVPLGLALRRVSVEADPLAAVVADLILIVVGTLMASAALAAAAETFYARGDLDLLLSAPLPPGRVLTVRALGIAVNVFAGTAALITPVIVPVALLGHPAWLAVYGVLAALALGSTGLGLLMAMGLIRVLGPRRTRATAQVLAAVLGAAIFLVSQARALMGQSQLSVVALAAARTWRRQGPPPAWALGPLRAMMGEAAPLVLMLAMGAGLLSLACLWAGPGFASDAARASGAGASVRRRAGAARFSTGAFAATLRKELRLLARDMPLLSQVLLRLLYLGPLTFVALRAASSGAGGLSMLGLVAGMTFLAGQAAGSLAWITLSAEDVPDLLASAPVRRGLVRRAKLTAAVAPVLALLTAPLFVLCALAPRAGLAAACGCIASSLASAQLHDWYARPARRADFRRRSSSSWTVGLAELTVCGLIAAAAGLAVFYWRLAPIPAVLAALALLALRRHGSRTQGSRPA